MKESEEIHSERSEVFLDLAKTLSEYVSCLELEKELNDELVRMLTQLIEQAERDSYKRGLKVGMEYNIDILISEMKCKIMCSEPPNRTLM
jgi:hypothetical protein